MHTRIHIFPPLGKKCPKFGYRGVLEAARVLGTDVETLDDDILKEFLVESCENLDQLDRDLVVLEKEPASADLLARIFRAAHTIKGTAGALGFQKLEELTHAGENLLGRLRDGELQFSAEIGTALLGMIDTSRGILTAIETVGAEGDFDVAPQVELLKSLDLASEEAEIVHVEVLPTPCSSAEPGSFIPLEPQPDEEPLREVSSNIPSNRSGPAPSSVTEARSIAATDTSIRVDVGVLDRLMNLVGELVLARNQILQFNATNEDAAFAAASQRLNLVTTELQEQVMKTRMQPIGNVWSKFPRVVRDLTAATGKQVTLEIEGKETELDRTIIEAIKDPLTHLLRNSIDHGIEAPEERTKKGKDAEGRVLLRAFHEGGQVNIEIADDGGGIPIDRVKQKAVRQGLLTSDQAARLSDAEAVDLIFLPGFSTAEKVTHISGRGVGMDVVRTNIEKIGGAIDVKSDPFQGTSFKIKIPLTLAIIPALLVLSGKERYAIPQVNLLELVRMEGSVARKAIEYVHGTPVYRLRGQLLPLVYLRQELRLEPPESGAGGDPEVIHIVVLQAGERPFGLVVDSIHDTEEIVVKPLSKHLKGLAVYAGATIMGDGKVALILDVLGLAQRASVVSGARDRALTEQAMRAQVSPKETQTLLVLASNDGGRMAVPLSKVDRLEEFPRSAIERAGGELVIQYRDEILPLVHLSDAIPERRRTRRNVVPDSKDGDSVHVVVYGAQGPRVGFLVNEILDIVEEELVVRSDQKRAGVLGSAVVQGRVTELVDLEEVMRMAKPPAKRRAARTRA